MSLLFPPRECTTLFVPSSTVSSVKILNVATPEDTSVSATEASKQHMSLRCTWTLSTQEDARFSLTRRDLVPKFTEQRKSRKRQLFDDQPPSASKRARCVVYGNSDGSNVVMKSSGTIQTLVTQDNTSLVFSDKSNGSGQEIHISLPSKRQASTWFAHTQSGLLFQTHSVSPTVDSDSEARDCAQLSLWTRGKLNRDICRIVATFLRPRLHAKLFESGDDDDKLDEDSTARLPMQELVYSAHDESTREILGANWDEPLMLFRGLTLRNALSDWVTDFVMRSFPNLQVVSLGSGGDVCRRNVVPADLSITVSRVHFERTTTTVSKEVQARAIGCVDIKIGGSKFPCTDVPGVKQVTRGKHVVICAEYPAELKKTLPVTALAKGLIAFACDDISPVTPLKDQFVWVVDIQGWGT